MKIVSIILLVIGLLLCLVSGVWTHFAVHNVMYDLMHSEVAGIGRIASNLTNAWYLSFVNMVGCVFIFLGVVLNIISMFKERKQTN